MRKGHQDFVTVVSDIDRGELIEVIDSHLQEIIIKTFIRQPIEVRKNVKEVSVDLWGGFPKVIQKVFPNAQIVFDRFHVMKGVNEELNKIRRECGVDVNKNRFIILRNGISLTDDEKVKLDYSKPKSTIQLWDGHLARHRLEARTTKLDNEIGLL